MLRLEQVNGKNVWDILKLSVEDDQKNFVASNTTSIIEAYTAISANGFAFPFGIYKDDTPVGFLMIGFDIDDYWDDAPPIAKGNYNLWRLMIDKAYQRRGFGKEAVQLALDFINPFPAARRNIAGYLMNRRMRRRGSCIIHLALLKPESWMEKN